MKRLAAHLLLAGACVEEHGSRPDPVGPALHGTWVAGADTLAFDQADRTMTWSNGEQFATGTWRINEPNRLELICPTCPFEDGLLPIRLDDQHLLIDTVMEGWSSLDVNAVWSGFTRTHECTFTRMITLATVDATDSTVACCGTASCIETPFTGPWQSTEDGFTITANGEARELFLMDNAISQRRWVRQ